MQIFMVKLVNLKTPKDIEIKRSAQVNFTHCWLKPTAICQHRHKVDSVYVVGFWVCFVLSTITLIIMFVLADGMDAIPTGNLNF